MFLLVEVNVLQERELAFNAIRYGHLPMWEVRRNVLLTRMPRNVLGLELQGRDRRIPRKDSISRRRVCDLTVISNCSECTAGHPGSTLLVDVVLRFTSSQGDTNVATHVRCPDDLQRSRV